MASNKHHELTKQVMARVSDLLTDYPVRQHNSFVNLMGKFPKLIRFDYLGKYSLKGETLMLVEAGLEIAADYTYFNTGYTWRNAKRKYYISNFGCYRSDLVPYTNEAFRSKTYELTTRTNGLVDVDLIRHELVHYFLPFLERLNTLNDLITFLHWHKPDSGMLQTFRNRSPFYNYLTVIYLLLTEGRVREAEFYLEKIIHLAHSLDQPNSIFQISEGLFVTIDKLQKDFALKNQYTYSEQQRRIIAT
jgi:hypothetical protein